MAHRPKRGFTLLEVMVAIAILGLGLTAILSAQAGAFANSAHARNISVATGLVRCKMTEVEEHLRHDGFTELDETDSGPCCDDQDVPHMQCSWKIEKPQFPEPKYGELDLDTDLDLGGGSDSRAGGPGKGPNPGAAAGALGGLTDFGQGNMQLDPGAGLSGLAQQIMPSGAEGGGPDMGGLIGTAMGLVYPSLKPLLEASSRRITVKVTWRAGIREQSIELVQWFTVPQQAPLGGGAGGGGGGSN
jgi:general secretion pathway protein I